MIEDRVRIHRSRETYLPVGLTRPARPSAGDRVPAHLENKGLEAISPDRLEVP